MSVVLQYSITDVEASTRRSFPACRYARYIMLSLSCDTLITVPPITSRDAACITPWLPG